MAEDEKFSQPEEGAQTPSPKRKAKRGWVIGGVVAAVIVVAGAGFWVWHETPSFCNSICHSPMDSYVDTYYSGDKGMLVTAHAEAGNNCLSSAVRNVLQHCNPRGSNVYTYFVRMN